jgi:hypothetical protein
MQKPFLPDGGRPRFLLLDVAMLLQLDKKEFPISTNKQCGCGVPRSFIQADDVVQVVAPGNGATGVDDLQVGLGP